MNNVWDIETGTRLLAIEDLVDVRRVGFSPDGKSLAVGTYPGFLKIWDLEQQIETKSYHTRSHAISGLAFSPDSQSIAIANSQTDIQIWDVGTGRKIREFPGHRQNIGVSLSADGKLIATAGSDGTVRIFDALSQLSPKQYSIQRAYFADMAVIPHTELLATSIKRSGPRSGVPNDFMLRIIDQNNGNVVRDLSGHSTWLSSVAASRNGKLITTGDDKSHVRLWRWPEGDSVEPNSHHQARVTSIDFCRNDTCIVAACEDSSLKVWNVDTLEELFHLVGHRQAVNQVVCLSEGKFIASASDDTTIRLWNSESGKCLASLSVDTAPVLALAVSPDGKWLLSGGRDSKFHRWNIDEITHRSLSASDAQIAPEFSWQSEGQQILGMDYSSLGSDFRAGGYSIADCSRILGDGKV